MVKIRADVLKISGIAVHGQRTSAIVGGWSNKKNPVTGVTGFSTFKPSFI